MKVIKDNRVESRFTFPMRLVCGRCKSELQADREDLKHADGSEMQGTNGFFYIQCPLCQSHNTVTPGKIITAEDYYSK